MTEISLPNQENTPETIAKNFVWDQSGLTTRDLQIQLKIFCEQSDVEDHLPTAEELLTVVHQASQVGKQVYQVIFPRGEQIYHNADHAKATLGAGVKIFLGWWQQIKDEVKTNFPLKQFELFTTASALHEINDWWNKSGLMDEQDFSLRRQAIIEIVNQYLQTHQISSLDLEKLLCLNSFVSQSTDSVQKALELSTPQFFRVSSIQSCLPNNETELKNLLTIYDTLLAGADFVAQLLDKNYLELTEVNLPNGKKTKKPRGVIALASEMRQFRVKAIPSQWKNEIGELDWSKIDISSEFLSFAIPKIEATLSYWVAFSVEDNAELKRKLELLKSINHE